MFECVVAASLAAIADCGMTERYSTDQACTNCVVFASSPGQEMLI